MRILVLGGTHFAGRHVVEAALARGDDVTIFNRGRTSPPWAGRVTELIGDRDPTVAPGLASLRGREFEAVIDTSGYVPRVVGASASLLSDRVRRYLFVSSMSVLRSASVPGLDESAPVAVLDEPGSEDVSKHYGALKAACEATVRSAFGDRATVVRPGLIVGPFDATDRFGYWVTRFVYPTLLGDRSARAVVPAPRERPVQFIDVRDLAAFMLDLVERDIAGTFNASSPAGYRTMGDVVDACRSIAAEAPEPAWVRDEVLLAHRVEPWTELPLWIPASQRDFASLMLIDCDKARDAGLRTRPLGDTVSDTAAWLSVRDDRDAWKQVLSAARERAILEQRGGD